MVEAEARNERVKEVAVTEKTACPRGVQHVAEVNPAQLHGYDRL